MNFAAFGIAIVSLLAHLLVGFAAPAEQLTPLSLQQSTPAATLEQPTSANSVQLFSQPTPPGPAGSSTAASEPAWIRISLSTASSETAYVLQGDAIYSAYNDGQIISTDTSNFVLSTLALSIAKDSTHVYCNYADGPSAIPGADALSFVVLSAFNDQSGATWYNYAIDKNHAYYDCKPIPGADPATFTIVGDDPTAAVHYAKDATHVYCGDCNDNDSNDNYGSIQQVVGADPGTFQLVDNIKFVGVPSPSELAVAGQPAAKLPTYYAEDKAHVYYFSTLVPNADPNTFQLVCTDFTDEGDSYICTPQ